MADYKSAIWQAIREICPTIQIRGCVLHWTLRIYKKIQTLGLTTAYTERKDKFIVMRKLMALTYLPNEQIRRAFQELRDQLPTTTPQQIQELMTYIQTTWIDGTIWTPRNWSAYREPIRTNIDVEGWHRRINGKVGRADLGFYVLVPLLFGEAQSVDLQIRLVSENLLQRTHRKQYQKTHGRLFDLWDKYGDEEITTKNLLRECAYIIGLEPTTTSSSNYDES